MERNWKMKNCEIEELNWKIEEIFSTKMAQTQPLNTYFLLNCTKIRQGSSSYLRQHLQKLWLAASTNNVNKVTWYNVIGSQIV